MTSLRTRVAISSGRMAGAVSRLTGRGQGATISGRVMNAIAPNLLRDRAQSQKVIIVSSTNGKTTTTRLLVDALVESDFPIITNATGANLASGIAPVLAGAKQSGLAILEVDERVVSKVIDPLNPVLLVLGNLSRDQLDRYGEVHAVSAAWRKLFIANPSLAVIANSSDPNIVWAASPGTVTWVALGRSWREDANTCPSCGRLLEWTNDSYDCPIDNGGCGFTQPEAVAHLNFSEDENESATLLIQEKSHELRLALPGKWNLANAALAVVAANSFGVTPKRAIALMATVTNVAGRNMKLPLGDGRNAQVLLAKNPAGWTEVLQYLSPRSTQVVVAVNARVADGKDTSWLYDVPYQLLRGHSVAAAGERCLDVAVRLNAEDLNPIIDSDPIAAARRLKGDDITIVASYTQFSALYDKYRKSKL
ncbi:MAG: MurT ligase domain-containing protein [Actinobacteria bacterium]|nr:MurT ligase domain-containing protein [Actinomycetota bacterium]